MPDENQSFTIKLAPGKPAPTKPPHPPHPPHPPGPTPVTPTPAPPTPAPPAPVPTSFVKMGWVRQSDDLTDEEAQAIVDALNLQVMDDLERGWPHVKSGNVWHYYAGTDPSKVPESDWPGYWLPDSDQAGALGYHDVDPQGRPYSRVFTRPTMQNGGSVLHGALSIAVTTSHEGCEQAVDPPCTLQYLSPDGVQWAGEVGDPTESDSYEKMLPDGQKVSVSNIVFQAFFNAGPGPTDALGICQPFTLRPGGYAIEDGNPVFAERYPEWRKATKLAEMSRTRRRGVTVTQLGA